MTIAQHRVSIRQRYYQYSGVLGAIFFNELIKKEDRQFGNMLNKKAVPFETAFSSVGRAGQMSNWLINNLYEIQQLINLKSVKSGLT